MAKTFIVETSARHVHLSEADFKVLFGENATLTKKKDLSQPGQYACEERVIVKGTKKDLPGVSILGPFRKESQVELSATDARSIGLGIAVRESGVLDGTPGCTLVGPAGEVTLEKGVIVAKRHIHATVADAKEHWYGVHFEKALYYLEMVGLKDKIDSYPCVQSCDNDNLHYEPETICKEGHFKEML